MLQWIDRAKHAEERTGRLRSLVGFLLFLCIVSAPIVAHGVDVTGTYELTVVDPTDSCLWEGPMVLTQTGTTFTGSISLPIVTGSSAPCPALIAGPVTGNVSGLKITLGFSSGGFGTATFTGEINPSDKSAAGTWTSSAPAMGTWSARNADVMITSDLTMKRTSPADGCEWTGLFTGTGSRVVPPFSGSIALMRVAGGSSCPASVTGQVSGSVMGSMVHFNLMSADFGDADFEGTVNIDVREAAGTWSGAAGSGTWSTRIHGATQAPALGGIALATLFGLLMAVGIRSTRRRSV